MISILQLNMQRSRTADQLLFQFAVEKGADILLLSEQYQNRQSPCWFSDVLGTASVWVIDSGKLPILKHGSGRGFVWVKSRGISFFSCYLTPNQSIADYRRMIDSLEDEVRNTSGGIIVTGDFNARAVEWGMPRTNTRGRYVLEMAARTGLHILNVGNVSTFRRPGYGESIPDISLASEGLVRRITDWHVSEDYSASDHQAILFGISPAGSGPTSLYRPSPSKIWDINRLDREVFKEFLPREVTRTTAGAEDLALRTLGVITTACDVAMPKFSQYRRRKPAYWWTLEIAGLRKRCNGLRRAAQRARDRPNANYISALHKAAKRELRGAIKRSKLRCWRELCRDVDDDPWGMGYKLVIQKLGARPPPSIMEPSAMVEVVNALFPNHPVRPVRVFGDVGQFELFSEEELSRAVGSLKNKKAPGPDGIPAEVLKLVVEINPKLLLKAYNACLSEGVFFSSWKVARLVLIPKAKGDPGAPSSFRPLCMLDTAGKVLEKMLRSRLTEAIVSAGDLSPQQHGFRPGHSTIDAIQEVVEAVRRAEDHSHWSRRVVLLVTLDVKNAFNSARWIDMLWALEHTFHVPIYLLRMIESYLRDRALLYDTLEGQRRIPVTSGAAQGSILGPDLWNVSYDGLLRLDMPDETRLVGYADDVAVLIASRTVDDAQIKLNRVMLRVNGWMRDHGLSLALSKTEIVVLTKKRIETIVPLRVGDLEVETKPEVKYLGVTIDRKVSFGEQIRRTAEKASQRVVSLGRLMSNVGGPRSSKRRLLMSSVQSVLLYGSEVWAHALGKKCYRSRLASVQRAGALRVASAYRTVSEPAIMVIAGVVPVHLLARERQAIYRRMSEVGRDTAAAEERERTFRDWQNSWDAETRGRWTARLIPQVRLWTERKHGEVGYYVTQFLSGHGYFCQYLQRMGKTASPDCLYCPGAADNAEHTFFACARWHARRQQLVSEIGMFSPNTITGIMLRGEDTWNSVARFVEALLISKKADLDRAIA